MHPTLRLLICTKDAEEELSLQSFADNHPDVLDIRMIDNWHDVLSASQDFEVLFLDAQLIPSPEALNRLPDSVSMILLARDTHECRRFRGTRVRSCLLTPVSWESFQWTLRSVQPLYATETA